MLGIKYMVEGLMFFFGRTPATDLLKDVAKEYKSHLTLPLSIEQQVFLMFINRLIIDTQSTLLLCRKGYIGSAYTLISVMLRNNTMYASLVADPTRMNTFWNEEEASYHTDRSFKKQFDENSTTKIAQGYFGDNTFQRGEFEKLLHGSCYAIRKYYSRKIIDSNGQRVPVLTFGPVSEYTKKMNIGLLVEGLILDFLGLHFTDSKNQLTYMRFIKRYHVLIAKAQLRIELWAKELAEQESMRKKGAIK